MPTYEYICTSCKNAWEAQQRMSEDALDTCPKCHQKTAERQISLGAGFILKGGGWYNDLYASGGAKKDPSAAGASTTDAKPDASADAKAETKTETKTETAKPAEAAAPAAPAKTTPPSSST